MSKQTELAQVADTITVNSGNVGIGTSSPNQPLTVATNSSAQGINITGRSSDDRAYMFFSDNNGTTYRGSIHTIPVDNRFNINAYSGENITFSNNGAEKVRIDASGRVTKPYQPSFTAQPTSFTGSGGIAGTQTFIFATTLLNIGGHFNTSNGRFTAPVDGNYFFTYSITASSSSKNARYFRVRLTKNGTTVINPHSTISDETGDADYNHISASGLVAMNANDYVELNYGSSIDASGLVFFDNMNTFSGFLMS